MIPPPYSIKPYTRGDFFLLLSFLKRRKKPRSPDFFLEKMLRGNIQKPGCEPKKDLFLARRKDRIVGWMYIYSERRLQRAVIESSLPSVILNNGCADLLLQRAVERAAALNAEKVHVRLPEREKKIRQFYAQNGFSPIRSFSELKREIQEEPLKPTETVQPEYACFKPGQEKKLADLQNDCFSGSWGFHPNTAEDIRFWLGFTDTKIEEVIVFKKGKETVGYCWAHLITSAPESIDKRAGRIHMLGVLPRFRGRGLGKKLTLSAFDFLKNIGAEVIYLAVDEANTKAVSLYRSLGFLPCARNLWYEKALHTKRNGDLLREWRL